MRVPKEIAEKADEYERLKKREEQLCEELTDWACKNGFEDLLLDGFGVSQEPEGEEQVDSEYCDQTTSGDGTYYFPIEDSTEYIWIKYLI